MTLGTHSEHCLHAYGAMRLHTIIDCKCGECLINYRLIITLRCDFGAILVDCCRMTRSHISESCDCLTTYWCQTFRIHSKHIRETRAHWIPYGNCSWSICSIHTYLCIFIAIRYAFRFACFVLRLDQKPISFAPTHSSHIACVGRL